MPGPTALSPFLTLAEAAAYLRLAPRTLDNMRQRGTGPIYGKHGGRVRYHRQDLDAWVNGSRRRTTTERAPPLAPQPPPALEAVGLGCTGGRIADRSGLTDSS